MELKVVKQWTVTYGFHQFSISIDHNGKKLLMREYNKGKVWFVVGYIDSDEEINLPKWIPVH